MNSTERIDTALKLVRGRMRTRTLDRDDVVQVVDEALRAGYGWVAGGTVANAYKYPAYRMCAAAARGTDGAVRVAIAVGHAKRGSSPTTPTTGLAKNAHVEDWQAWADGPLPSRAASDLRLSVREAVALVAERRRRAREWAREQMAQWHGPNVPVTVQDSLEAGNCPLETARVAEWFPGRQSVPARMLLAAVVKRAPGLWTYAIRAINQARKRYTAWSEDQTPVAVSR